MYGTISLYKQKHVRYYFTLLVDYQATGKKSMFKCRLNILQFDGFYCISKKSRFKNHCWIFSVICEILDLKNAFDFSKNLDFYLLNCTSYPTEGFKKRIIWLNSFFILIHLHFWIFTGPKYKFDSNFYYLCRVGLILFSSLINFLPY